MGVAPGASVPSITITQTKLLLVEGEDEKQFCDALLSSSQKRDVQVLGYGGKDNLKVRFPAIIRAPGFDRVTWLGIAQDADDDPVIAFQRVRDVLSRNAFSAPPGAWTLGPGQPDVMVFICPDGARTGDIEELLWDAVVAESPADVACIAAYFHCLRGATLQGTPAKARVHALLASLSRPDHRMGTAAQAGLLPLSSAVFDRFRSLIP
jgi:hypothetical protein